MRGRVNGFSSLGRWALAAILIGGVGLAATPLYAKHQAPQPDSEAEPQESPEPAEASAPGHHTVIKGEFLESHDLLGDANDPTKPELTAIQWAHNFTVVLSGKNNVSEKWINVRATRGIGATDTGARSGKRPHSDAKVKWSTGENSVTIGDKSGRAVWHVLGDKKLQRIFPGQHFLMMMNIEIGADNGCGLEVKYLRQEGFSSIVMPQPGGLQNNFSLPRVESASCSIQ